MGIFEKSRFWRGLGVFVNLPGVDRAQDSLRGVTAAVGAAMTRVKVSGDIPWTPLSRPLSECTVGLVSTAGLYPDGAEPFDVDSKDGDASFREIPSDIAFGDLRIAHVHFPHFRYEQDPNVLLPLDGLRAMAEHEVIGRLAPRFFGFGFGAGITGGYINPETGTAHRIAARMKQDGVDLVLLVPA